MALTMLGRYHLLRGEIEDAVHVLDQALDEVDSRGMTAFVSWPESFRAELDLVLGDVDAAEARFEHAFALGCQVGDACWESIGLRGLGLVAAARGDVHRALDLLVEAPKLCRRLPDTYLWIEAYASTPSAPSPSSMAPRRPCAGSTSSRRSPRGGASASSLLRATRLPRPAGRARRARRRALAGRADRQSGARPARDVCRIAVRPVSGFEIT